MKTVGLNLRIKRAIGFDVNVVISKSSRLELQRLDSWGGRGAKVNINVLKCYFIAKKKSEAGKKKKTEIERNENIVTFIEGLATASRRDVLFFSPPSLSSSGEGCICRGHSSRNIFKSFAQCACQAD